jgi:hypothetical protein
MLCLYTAYSLYHVVQRNRGIAIAFVNTCKYSTLKTSTAKPKRRKVNKKVLTKNDETDETAVGETITETPDTMHTENDEKMMQEKSSNITIENQQHTLDTITPDIDVQDEKQHTCVKQILKIITQHITTVNERESMQNHEQDFKNARKSRVADCVKIAVNETPFVQMLSSMALPKKVMQIPLISRKYEEKFMRACVDAEEKPCSMHEKCECMFIDPEQPFVCVKFQIPNVSGTDMHTNTLCILCLRKQTLLLFYRTMHAGYDPGVLIQKHGNICNEPGEYARSAMIFANPNGPVQCMPLPIVAHQRNRYQVVTIAGIQHLRQTGVSVHDDKTHFFP